VPKHNGDVVVQLQEECRGWDINESVFSPGMWEMYEPMLRADFKLFDEYEPSIARQANDAAPFVSRMRLFWGERDRRVTQDMVKVGVPSRASAHHRALLSASTYMMGRVATARTS
jgi:surfactin synthase thioesterase subunit